MNSRQRAIPSSKAYTPRPSLPAALPYAFPAEGPPNSAIPHVANIMADYTVVVDRNRKYVEVSDSFCKLLGYQRHELIGRKYDELTAPRTNDIPTVHELFKKSGYMHGIWILLHRRGTRILVRYECWQRPDGLTEGQMELLGAGA